eukprot:COSAG01_NODE_56026_length_321_cov_0.693694_1_plen_92_part_10
MPHAARARSVEYSCSWTDALSSLTIIDGHRSAVVANEKIARDLIIGWVEVRLWCRLTDFGQKRLPIPPKLQTVLNSGFSRSAVVAAAAAAET